MKFHHNLDMIEFDSYLLLYGKVIFFTNRIVLLFFNCLFFFSPFAQLKVLADETDRPHFESELLRGTANIIEHDVHKRHLFHLWCVDLKYCLFIALFHLSRRKDTAGGRIGV